MILLTLPDLKTDERYADATPCVDELGYRSTVGFERLWREVLVGAMKPVRYIDTHDIDPFTLVCRSCGRSDLAVRRDKIRCGERP